MGKGDDVANFGTVWIEFVIELIKMTRQYNGSLFSFFGFQRTPFAKLIIRNAQFVFLSQIRRIGFLIKALKLHRSKEIDERKLRDAKNEWERAINCRFV